MGELISQEMYQSQEEEWMYQERELTKMNDKVIMSYKQNSYFAWKNG